MQFESDSEAHLLASRFTRNLLWCSWRLKKGNDIKKTANFTKYIKIMYRGDNNGRNNKT